MPYEGPVEYSPDVLEAAYYDAAREGVSLEDVGIINAQAEINAPGSTAEAYSDYYAPYNYVEPQGERELMNVQQAGGPLGFLPALAGAAIKYLPAAITLGKQVAPYLGAGLAGFSLGQMGNGKGAVGALGGGDFVYKGVLFQGPGIKEPQPSMVMKSWWLVVNGHRIHFFRLINRKMVSINESTGKVSVWSPAKHLVISKNPRVPQLLTAAKKIDNLMLKLDRRMGKFRSRTRITRTRRHKR